MNRVVKRVLLTTSIILAVIAGVYFCWLAALASAFGAFDRTYTPADLGNHYEAHAPALWALTSYVNALVPAHHTVEIEFGDQRTIAIFHVKANGVYANNWNLPWDAPKTDSLLHVLGWTRQTLRTLQEKLAQVDCISIASGEPSTVGYHRSGLGKYSFQFFARPATDSVKRQYSRRCTYIFYKPRVVLAYGGGAVGPQCWPQDLESKPAHSDKQL
jgi:hypothetical protein